MMNNLDACFMSQKDNWETPDGVFARLDLEFHFDADVAASPQNAKVPTFYCEDHWRRSQPRTDGMVNGFQPNTTVWCNPPYGPAVTNWLQAAVEAQQGGTTSVFLLPSRTDVAWWHMWVWDDSLNCPRRGVEVRFLRGRIRFKGARASAPFPSVIIVFSGHG